MKISKKNLKRLLQVWKHKNYEYHGTSKDIDCQYIVCNGCHTPQYYLDDYRDFPHDEGCQVAADELYADHIEKKITRK